MLTPGVEVRQWLICTHKNNTIFLKFHAEHRAHSNNTELMTSNLATVNRELAHPILCELKLFAELCM